MKKYREVCDDLYLSIDFVPHTMTTLQSGLEGSGSETILPGHEQKRVNVPSTLATVLLHSVTIASGHAEVAGTLRVESADGALAVAFRAAESSLVSIDGGEPAPIPASSAVVLHMATRADIACGPGELTLVAIPRETLRRYGLRQPATPAIAAQDDPALGIFLAQARSLLGSNPPPALALLCETSLLGLLALAFTDPPPGARRRTSAPKVPLFQDILRTIAANCSQHDFSAAQVAEQYRMNVRTLQKLFQQHGTTFHQHISSARLQVARQALLDPANNSKNISEIAFEAGFNDIATFNRLFRKTFNDSPSNLRRQRASRQDA
ncbi:AraC family transcriptional regulator [Xanthobacter autotrophicus DSM 431]|uniref:helix-turn-helix transcriptional regulator n=1 Tax=Xanthobacter nonsaccharivorans TaxID=3119912 RepID=UPI00372A3542